MKVILISDPEADISAASLDVAVGSCLDPKPTQGIAHFLEHMLFMGTTKYPSENEYSEYIKNNGGNENAWTDLDNTNYQFEVSNEGFQGALDRFAQFFISPLMSESATEREMKAVDSEWNMNLSEDFWLDYALMFKMSNKDSPMDRFTIGNMESLKKEGIREALLKFHKDWYSSNIMTLAITSNSSLDELEKMAVELFSGVENKNVKVPDFSLLPRAYNSTNLGRLTKSLPIQDKDRLVIKWIVPYCGKDHRTSPLNYFCHLFGHEGEHSILSYLKREGLAQSLSADDNHYYKAMSDFTVEILLTEKGL